jgi:hypothetical protein
VHNLNIKNNKEKNMEEQTPTLEEILGTIKAARDSVWVIDSSIEKEVITEGIIDDVKRNVAHLQIVTSSEHIINSGEDISDLLAAIENGNTFIEAQQQEEVVSPQE